jgi:hypothetical protein
MVKSRLGRASGLQATGPLTRRMNVKASPTQRVALADAVFIAYEAGWSGSARQRSKRPAMRLKIGGFRARGVRKMGVSGPTWDALLTKGLIAADGTLTKAGVEVGVEDFKERNGDKHPGVLAEENAGKRMSARRDKEEKVARAKRLLRGLKISEKRQGSIRLADHINENGLSLNALWLDDLIALGEGIQKLRN